MISKKYLLLLMCSMLTLSFMQSEEKEHGPRCKTEKSCLKNKSCECYCSQICGFRKKDNTDDPVFVPDDKAQNYCYCKQWDLDEYENRKCDIEDTKS